MSWPVTQRLPQAAATISILQANVNRPTVKDMLEANKCLRFMKEVCSRSAATERCRTCALESTATLLGSDPTAVLRVAR